MEGKKRSSFAAEGEASPAAILARPLLMLRHAAHGCAGYLVGLASRLKPAATEPHEQEEEEDSVEPAAAVTEEMEVVEMRSRGMPPPRPRGLLEGSGGKHHK